MIPQSWLQFLIPIEHVLRLAAAPAWSAGWQRLAESIEPGDQVWFYASQTGDTGCALVRSDLVIDLVAV
jgi:hypothetical protein